MLASCEWESLSWDERLAQAVAWSTSGAGAGGAAAAAHYSCSTDNAAGDRRSISVSRFLAFGGKPYRKPSGGGGFLGWGTSLTEPPDRYAEAEAAHEAAAQKAARQRARRQTEDMITREADVILVETWGTPVADERCRAMAHTMRAFDSTYGHLHAPSVAPTQSHMVVQDDDHLAGEGGENSQRETHGRGPAVPARKHADARPHAVDGLERSRVARFLQGKQGVLSNPGASLHADFTERMAPVSVTCQCRGESRVGRFLRGKQG